MQPTPRMRRGRRIRSPRRAVLAAGAAATALLAATLTSLTFAASSSATTVPGPPSGWTTTYSDSFSGSAGSGVDSGWTYDTGTQYNGTGCTGQYGTGEVESNTSSTANVSEDGSGHLNVTAVNSGGSWTSGRIETTSDSFEAPAGGEMEVSASIKQPNPSSGVGYWPAFWMLGAGFRSSGAGTSGTMDCSNWPSAGEIDVMEDVNALSEHSGTFHCGVNPGGPCNETTGLGSGLQSCSGCQTGYNTYSAIVNRTNTSNESITFLLNGNAYYTVTESQVGTSTWQAAVDHGFFLILDLAIGGAYPNAICGCSSPTSATSSGGAMSVGYVAVYETSGSGASPTPTPTPTPDADRDQHRQRRRHVLLHHRDRGHLRGLLPGLVREHLGHRGQRGHQPVRGGRQSGRPAHQRRLPGVSRGQFRLGLQPVRRPGRLRRGGRGERPGRGGARQPVEPAGGQLRGR